LVRQTKRSIQQSHHNLSLCSVIETSCCFGSSQSQKEHIHCFLVLLIFFPFEDTRCLYRTESECHEHCRTHTQEPVCHGVVSGLRQVNFCVGRICSSTGLRINGVNVQHIAVFVGQRNFASFLRACSDFCICRRDTGFLLVIVDCPAAKIFVCNVGHTCGSCCCDRGC